MIKCYRIENAQGVGPYRGVDCETWNVESHNYGDRTPGPYSDFHMNDWAMIPPYTKRTCVFGFRTLKQLRYWFNEIERHRLRGMGYVIVRIEAHQVVAQSRLQCAFVPSENYLPTVAK